MRLQVIDPQTRFGCHSCGACCDQPWRTAIEAVRAHALDRHDWSKYPQLTGRSFYHAAADGREGFYDLAKGEGTRCVFLDTDGLCIIHKELGPEAKPAMCQQFPFLAARTWVDERVSANYGCPSVQKVLGEPIATQAAEIGRIVTPSGREAKPGALVPLTGDIKLSMAENDALLDRILVIFDEGRAADIWSRFAESLALVSGAAAWKGGGATKEGRPEPRIHLRRADGKGAGLTLPIERDGLDSHIPDTPEIVAFESAGKAPLASRMLFAATLHPDTVPADVTGRMGLARKLTLIPKLINLAQLSGVYASRLMGRNLSIDAILRHRMSAEMDTATMRLLLRYFRARIWQRMLVGTRLSIAGGLHQHIHDFNAVLFFARAEALERGEQGFGEGLIRATLTRVEFHLANQPRLHDQVLRGWFRRQLDDIGVALASLRMMAMGRNDELPMTNYEREYGAASKAIAAVRHS